MSAYVFDNIDLQSAQMQQQQSHSSNRNYDFSYGGAPQSAASMMVPLEQQQQYFAGGSSHAAAFQSCQHQQTPHPEFVVNVSDDDTVERDIDLEIEARIRSLTLLSDEENMLNMSMGPSPQAPPLPTTPDLPRTMSQRMLSSLQKNKLRQTQRTERGISNASSASRHDSYAPAASTPAPVRSENFFYQSAEVQTHPDGDNDVLRPPQLSRKSSSSATDRLEARISKSFLNRQDSITSAADANDFSSLYSGRRTYPAESVKKIDQRLSEGTPSQAQPETSMAAALEKERVALALAGLDKYGPSARKVEPVVEKVRQEKKKTSDAGVSFHFYGGSSSGPSSNNSSNSSSRGTTSTRTNNRLALTAAEASPSMQCAPQQQIQTSHAMVVPARSSSALDPKYTVLANQLGDIEKLIDGIENVLSASTLSSMAPIVLGELDLLKGSTKQIRTNGATLILAEVGRPPTETVNALRRLVTRAGGVQRRIESIMEMIQGMA